MSLLSTLITSPPDRENCVCEVWVGSSQMAEISHEPGMSIEIEIYSPSEGGNWNLKLEELMAVLNQATKNLASHE